MKRLNPLTLLCIALFFSQLAVGQSYDLQQLLKSDGLTVIDRKVTPLNDGGKKAVSFSDKSDAGGYALIKGLEFSEGTIEVDIKGKDVQGKNFVGVAFHAVPEDGKETAADIVYFRPFNFKSGEQIRRSHSVQYVSPPQWDWSDLREKYTGVYENEIPSPPDPNGWFHARIEVKGKEITVYVDDAKEPCLKVTKLNDRTTGSVGIWVGYVTNGDFANLTIKKSK
ncbi:MAG: hypothetical protein RIE86_27880 [Imperialibacter sp.]|uniref:hypothetical protein n=1 Tax=Imperialibacter sp. TaxID=2038411 RepID=UPI0032EB8BBD